MSRAWKSVVAAAAVAVSLIGVAFAVAPRACAGGLEIYFWLGVAALVVMLTLPFVFRSSESVLARALSGLGFAVLGAIAWIVGLFAADVRIMCRLF